VQNCYQRIIVLLCPCFFSGWDIRRGSGTPISACLRAGVNGLVAGGEGVGGDQILEPRIVYVDLFKIVVDSCHTPLGPYFARGPFEDVKSCDSIKHGTLFGPAKGMARGCLISSGDRG